MPPVDIQILSRHPIASHGTTQLRCVQPAEVLRDLGYTVEVNTIFRARPKARTAIVLHRAAYDPYTRDFIKIARARRVPLIYDTDDLLFNEAGMQYLSRGPKAVSYRGGHQPFAQALEACDHVTCSTQFLADQAARLHPNTTLLRNTLSHAYLDTSRDVLKGRQQRRDDMVTFAYLSGSKSHDADFAVIEDALLKVLTKHPKTRLLLVGPLEVSPAFDGFGDRVQRQGFKPYSEFATVFETIDVNLVPLEIAEAFCQAKSELKFIEAGACGVVTVATPTAPHKAVIRPGENGLLADAHEWEACLTQLLADRALRDTLGAEAQKTVARDYAPNSASALWSDILATVSSSAPEQPPNFFELLPTQVSLHRQYWKRFLKRTLKKMRRGGS